MLNTNSRRMMASAESSFFRTDAQIERLRDQLEESKAECKMLYETLLMVCSGYTSPEDGLKLIGMDPKHAATTAAKIPTQDEVDAARSAHYAPKPPETPIKGWVVYYVQMNDRVKIGTTCRFVNRMRTMYVEPHDVLAVEDGGQDLERQRHEQFAHLRMRGRELFSVDDSLRDHMLNLRSERPDPWAYGMEATTHA